MPLRQHLRLLVLCTLAWLAFWVAGLPDYYRQYSTVTMVAFDLAVLPAMALVFRRYLRMFSPDKRRTASLWLAFYATVPIAVYDWLYCGIHLGHGAGYLGAYWYLTVYYLIPWILAPCLVAGRGDREAAA